MPNTEHEIDAEKAAKPRLDLVPPRAVLAAGRALGFGANKHGTPAPDGWGSWRIPDTEQAEPLTHYTSLMRHLMLWRGGEERDRESGLPHLDHAIAQLSILVDLAEDPPVEAPDVSASADTGDTSEPPGPWALPEDWEWRRTPSGKWFAECVSGLTVTTLTKTPVCLERDEAPDVHYLVLRRNREDPPK